MEKKINLRCRSVLWKIMGSHKVAMLLSIAGGTVAFGIISLLGNNVGTIIGQQATVVYIVGYVIVGWLLIATTSFVAQYGIAWVLPQVRKTYGEKIFNYLQKTRPNVNNREFSSYVNIYTNALSNLIYIIMDDIFPKLLFCGYVINLFYMAHPLLCVLSVMWAVVTLWLNVYINSLNKTSMDNFMLGSNKKTHFENNVFHNFELNSIFNLHTYIKEKFNTISHNLLNKEYTYLWRKAFIPVGICVFTAIMQGLFTFILMAYVDPNVSNRAFILAMNGWFMFVIYFRAEAVMRLLNDIGMINSIHHTLAKLPLDTTPGNVKPDQLSGKIEIKNLELSSIHNNGSLINCLLNFHIPAGSKILIVGASGIGKSTLFKVLAKFSEACDKTVFIDDNDINNLDKIWLRDHIAYITQENNFYEDSVLENIQMGDLDASQEEINAVLKQVGIYELVMNKPMKYNTKIHEFSVGQRRRLAIARAILSKNRSLLLCDEILSSLDYKTAKQILQTVLDVSHNKTLLFVTHEFIAHVAEKMDFVLWLTPQGSYFGTYPELLTQNGFKDFIGLE